MAVLGTLLALTPGEALRREARLEGHVLTDRNLRFLVVGGEQVGRGEHVDAGGGLQRVEHHAEGGDTDAECRQRRNGRALDAGEEAAVARRGW